MAPRYLAGDDGQLADRVTAALTSAGWRHRTTRHYTPRLFSDDQLRGADWLQGAPELFLDDSVVVWTFFARRHVEGLPVWTAHFTEHTPHEPVVAFANAVAAAPDVTRDVESGRTALEPLAQADWAPDPTDEGNTFWAPRLQACVSFRELPPEIHDGNPLPGLPGYLAYAEVADRAPRQWVAAFSPSTPQGLVRAFTACLADPRPVERTTLPADAEGHLFYT
ncbi:DUF317 domain-containing protein [Streptomyces sp. NPDC001739]